MHSMKRIALAAVLGVVLSAPMSAQAASSSGPSISSMNTLDLYYDWQVWIAEDVAAFQVIVQYDNLSKAGFLFYTLEEAQQFVAEVESQDGVYDAAISMVTVQGPWQLIATYDKKSTADAIAQYAIALGFYAKVEAVSIFQYRYQLKR